MNFGNFQDFMYKYLIFFDFFLLLWNFLNFLSKN